MPKLDLRQQTEVEKEQQLLTKYTLPDAPEHNPSAASLTNP